LADSGRFTHKVVTRPAISLAQDRESSPARTGGLTTMLRNQLWGATNLQLQGRLQVCGWTAYWYGSVVVLVCKHTKLWFRTFF